MVICLLLAMVKCPDPEVSLVIVEPAAMNEPLPIITGAISIEPEPMKELSLTIVLCLFTPS